MRTCRLLLVLLLTVPLLAHAANIEVEWDYSATGHTGFQLKRCTGSACTPTTNVGSVLGTSVRTATDATVTQGSSYCYGVLATDAPDSALSNTLCATVPTPGSTILVTLAWDYSATGHTGFQLKRCTGTSCTPSTNVGSVLGTGVRQTTDATVTGGVSYCYGIVATDAPDSALSATTCLTIPTPGQATQLAFQPGPPATATTNQAMPDIRVEVRDAFDRVATTATGTVTLTLGGIPPLALPQNTLMLVSVDSQETQCGSGQGTNALDGVTTTIWLTQFCPTLAPLPHTIIVDLGATYQVSGFRYLPRQDWGDGTAGAGGIATYQWSVSTDGANWGTVAASGTFANTNVEKTVNHLARTGRYVRLVATSEVTGQQYTNIAELTVLHTPGGSGLLQGTTTREVGAGVATFPALSVSQRGSYTLVASSSGLTSIEQPFTVVDPTALVHVPVVRRRVP